MCWFAYIYKKITDFWFQVLKVAILAEKYAVDYTWYVDVILNLIRIAGDYVSEEVWYRVIQIVINRDDVQGYAAKTVYEVRIDLVFFPNFYYHHTLLKSIRVIVITFFFYGLCYLLCLCYFPNPIEHQPKIIKFLKFQDLGNYEVLPMLTGFA